MASPMVQLCTNPCSAMRPKIKPSTIGDTEKPRFEAIQPMTPNTIMMPISEMLLRIAKDPITVINATIGTKPAFGARTIAR